LPHMCWLGQNAWGAISLQNELKLEGQNRKFEKLEGQIKI
jgi:hypothetical protein